MTCRCGIITGWHISGHNTVIAALCEISLDGTLLIRTLLWTAFLAQLHIIIVVNERVQLECGGMPVYHY
jgi:hypothetical protein